MWNRNRNIIYTTKIFDKLFSFHKKFKWIILKVKEYEGLTYEKKQWGVNYCE